MSKLFLVILGVTVAGLIGVFLIFNQKPENTPSNQNQDPHTITEQDHVKGKADAKVTLIEYGDFQCPACGAAEPLVQQLNQEFGDRIRFVFRHFPLTNIHPNAFVAARAAEAAAGQDKFWEMHDLLYEKQKDWAESSQAPTLFREYAKELGLDIDKFNDIYNTDASTDRVNNDVNLGQQLEVQGTPTFYINSQKLEPNPRTYAELKAKIEEALAKNP